jgi:hypothetical protein
MPLDSMTTPCLPKCPASPFDIVDWNTCSRNIVTWCWTKFLYRFCCSIYYRTWEISRIIPVPIFELKVLLLWKQFVENNRINISQMFLRIWRRNLVTLTHYSSLDFRYIKGHMALCSVGATVHLRNKHSSWRQLEERQLISVTFILSKGLVTGS